jgi:hypothetical protein
MLNVKCAPEPHQEGGDKAKYLPIFSSRHQKEVSGQVHASAVLHSGKDPQY